MKYWLPAVLWMGLIFIGSTDLLSSERTSRFIGPILRWIKKDVSEDTIRRVQLVVRKLGHLAGYAILSILLLRAIRPPPWREVDSWEWWPAAWALLGAILFAVTDEYHQSLVFTRFGSVWDVGVDALGATLGIGLAWWGSRRQRGG